MKFKENDRISLGGIPGTVTALYQGTYARSALYDVTFDGHIIGGALGDELRANRFTGDWFDEHAEPYADPEPTATDFLLALTPGDRFTLVNHKGDSIWTDNFVTFIGIKYSNDNGSMIRGIRYGIDSEPVDLFVINTDILTKTE